MPTLLTAIYYLAFATPRYVSEARFIVRAASQEQPSALGVALQGVGLSASATDSFAVHEYIRSRDALAALEPKIDVAKMLAPAGADLMSRHPRPWEGETKESLYKGLQRFVTVGYETSTGISTLRVESFRAQDSQKLAAALLDSGEELVNKLNERSSASAVIDAERTKLEAETRLRDIQVRLTAFRNREGMVDPTLSATENSALIGELLSGIATLEAERSQLAAQAPNSPQLPILDGRLAAFRRQLAEERAKIAGGAGSLATKFSEYETLAAERTLAERAMAAASTALDTARVDARRQKLYLERIVSPSVADKATEPNRLRAILIVLISTLLIYGIGWLVWAGLREHRQL
ncbi:chain-length determining protein [Brevundimonas sp.]|uniref:chain-length determining protein n=1 Tax=Brevundimonas sp. TaxID=1871086 RepID=UPI003D6D7BBA